MAVAELDGAVAIRTEGGHVGLLTCPLCGTCLMIDPTSDVDVARLHSEWHQRRQAIDMQTFREPSDPEYRVGDFVRVRVLSRDGRIVDRWEEPGPVHWYTIRLDGCELTNRPQSQLEPAR